jgi:protein SCO1/2
MIALFALFSLMACNPVPSALPAAPVIPAAPAPTAALPPAELPSGSLYRLAAPLVDQSGRPIGFDADRGHPTLVAMFYTSCAVTCPTLIARIQAVEAAVDAAHRPDLRVLLISFDPARDTPERLALTARRHDLDAQWTLATPPATSVDDLTAILGVQVRKLNNGEFNHGTSITLVDSDGVPLARADSLASAMTLVDAIDAIPLSGV